MKEKSSGKSRASVPSKLLDIIKVITLYKIKIGKRYFFITLINISSKGR